MFWNAVSSAQVDGLAYLETEIVYGKRWKDQVCGCRCSGNSCDYFISLIKIGKKIVCCKQAGGVGEVVIWGGVGAEWESEATGGVRCTFQWHQRLLVRNVKCDQVALLFEIQILNNSTENQCSQ